MSANILSDNQLAALARAYSWCKREWSLGPSVQTVLDDLVAENYRSVNARYNENTAPKAININDFDLKLSTSVEILALCYIYEYQSCEAENYRDSRAAKWIEQIRYAAINALPGFDKACIHVGVL